MLCSKRNLRVCIIIAMIADGVSFAHMRSLISCQTYNFLLIFLQQKQQKRQETQSLVVVLGLRRHGLGI